MPAPTLTDGSVTMRALLGSDVEGVLEQCTDPLSQRWTQVPIPYYLDDARSFVTGHAPHAWESGEEWIFAVESLGRYAGNIALRDEGVGRAEIAFGSHPWVRGTGAMDRALRLLLRWGFHEQEVNTVIWRAQVGNWASRKVAWRLGFTFDGLLRHSLPHRGELLDGWLGTLRRHEPLEPRRPWLDIPVLAGDGLRLRPFTQSDVPRIVEACRDSRTQQWLGRMPSPYGEDEARSYLEHLTGQRATGGGVTWAVADAVDDRLLASVGFFDYEPGVECEIGYWTHPDARGGGVMTRAFAVVMRYCFEQLKVNRVKAFAAVDNAGSRHVIEANGLIHTGVERRGTEVRSGLADVALYDVLAKEYAARAATTTTRKPASDSAAPTSAGARKP